MKGARKYYFRMPLPILTRKECSEYLHKNVFDTPEFEVHVNQVAVNLKIDQRIVKAVLISYFTNVMILINSTRKIKTKINIYGFFSIIVEKGDRF